MSTRWSCGNPPARRPGAEPIAASRSLVSKSQRWRYAAGDLGFNFVWQSIELYLLFYYIRGIGLTPATASGIFLIGAAIDCVSDPLIGAAADRWASRIPLTWWVLAGGPLSVMLLGVAFAAPAAVGPGLAAPVALATFLALRIAYGVGNIPYAAMTARISPRAEDQISLTASRMQGAAIGGLIAATIYALLPGGKGGAAFSSGAMLLALLATPAFAVLRPIRLHPSPATARIGLGQSLLGMARLLSQSAALRRLLLTILMAGLSVTLLAKSLLFLFDEMGERQAGFYVALVPSLSLLLAAPVWSALGQRHGRVRILQVASGLKVLALGLALFGGGLAPMIALCTLAIIAGAGVSVMFWSLVPAVVELCERVPGESSCAGRVYSLATMVRKLAQAIAPQGIALALMLPGVQILWAIAAVALVGFLVTIALPPS